VVRLLVVLVYVDNPGILGCLGLSWVGLVFWGLFRFGLVLVWQRFGFGNGF
jgi:hypothetical protein